MNNLANVRYQFGKAVQRNEVHEALELALARKNEFRALVTAISYHRYEIAEWLIRLGWDVNEVQEHDGMTPLHAAIRKRYVGLVSQLIFRGANIYQTDNTGNTPLATCVKVKMNAQALRIYQILASRMTDTDFHGKNILGDTLLHAVGRNAWAPLDVYRDLIRRGVDVNERDAYTGRNFVMEMLIFQTDEYFAIRVVSLAIHHGLDINATDAFGNTILHRMASEGREIELRWFSGLPNVRVRVANTQGQTPIWIAARRGNTKVFQMLHGMGETVEGEAYLYSGGQVRKTVREVALGNENYEIAELVDQELGARGREESRRSVKSLFALTRKAIRDELVKDGMNMAPKIERLGLPKVLEKSLGFIE